MRHTMHTKGAIRAAEIITNDKYIDGSSSLMMCSNCDCIYETQHGRKTVEGIADIIDSETHVSELLVALKYLMRAVKGGSAAEMEDALEGAQVFMNKINEEEEQ